MSLILQTAESSPVLAAGGTQEVEAGGEEAG